MGAGLPTTLPAFAGEAFTGAIALGAGLVGAGVFLATGGTTLATGFLTGLAASLALAGVLALGADLAAGFLGAGFLDMKSGD